MSAGPGCPVGGPRRRGVLAAAAALPLAAACSRRPDGAAPPLPPVSWVGASPDRGHRLRPGGGDGTPVAAAAGEPLQRAQVLVVGAGIAGLAAARGFLARGIGDVRVFELEDAAGGNSRGHRIAGIGCPLGAHYLPLPGPQAHEVSAWLHELGLLRSAFGRTLADERHLCHSPQERLFIDGAWVDGLLPPAEPGSPLHAAYRRFGAAVAAQAGAGFAIPSHRAPWTAAHQALDAEPFGAWLQRHGITEPALRWVLDYCCRDDYGADADAVSAWAGIHYFASRHGFAAPGDGDGPQDAVFTWPEGNAWLVDRLAAPLGSRLLTARTVLRVEAGKHDVELLAVDARSGRFERWAAARVVLAVPVHVAARILQQPPPALSAAATQLVHAPWLVAQLHVDRLPLARPGAAPAWDNVAYGTRGLGYVDAMHQTLQRSDGPTVLSAYLPLPPQARPELLHGSAETWASRVLADLAPLHPDLRERLLSVQLARWGHAMALPAPGVRGSAALAALRRHGPGRIRFAHADLAGTSVFEESFTLGSLAAAA